MNRIFLSYRRDDTADITGRISDYLSDPDRFGDRVFQDVFDIAKGVHWDEAIDRAMAASSVVLVMIGPQWLTATSAGKRRLDDPEDELRMEVSTALRRSDIRVIPVLVGGAEIPAAEALPDDLKDLTRRQAFTVRSGEHFRIDVAALAEDIEPSRPPRRWPWMAVAGVAVAVGSISVALALTNADDDDEPVAASTLPPVSTTSPVTATSTPPGSTTTTSTTTLPSIYQTEPLKGTFNVAVVAFESDPEADRDTSREALNAAESLRDYLDTELERTGSTAAALRDVRVGLFERPAPGPDGVVDLEALAEEYDAHLVVTATLTSDPASGRSSFIPVFVIRGDPSERNQLLAGGYGLGSPKVFEAGFGESSVKATLRVLIQRRSCILTHLATGLSLYRSELFEDAAQSFEDAANATGCPEIDSQDDLAEGQEIAYFFLGNIAILSFDEGYLATAEAWYDRALEVDPAFVRASFGIAEVAFQRVNADCRRQLDGPADVEALRTANDEYDAAFGSYREGLEEGAERVPRLATQARFRAGRVQLCLAVVTNTSADSAQADFQRVVDAYLDASPEDRVHLVEVAAEAYAALAYIALQADSPDPEEAVDLLTKAIDLETYERIGVYLATRAYAYELLGAPEAAAADCAAAQDMGDTRCPLSSLDAFLASFSVTLAATGLPTWWITAIGLLLALLGAILVHTGRRLRLRDG